MSAETHEGTSVSALTPKSEWKKWVGLQSRARLMTKWPLTVGCGRNSKSDRNGRTRLVSALAHALGSFAYNSRQNIVVWYGTLLSAKRQAFDRVA